MFAVVPGVFEVGFGERGKVVYNAVVISEGVLRCVWFKFLGEDVPVRCVELEGGACGGSDGGKEVRDAFMGRVIECVCGGVS